jgi:hypothetical protein
LFGRNKNKKETNSEEIQKEKPINSGVAQYIGGHIEYPKSEDIGFYLYNERLSIWFATRDSWLRIPYSTMISIENMDEKKISADRVFMLGVVGALWKKKHIYTIIRYKDELDEHKIILDFEDNVEYAQGLIYKKMLEARKRDDVSKPT